jgi:ABC-type Zn2+ transport system substrate-binding protein/surface adhesin
VNPEAVIVFVLTAGTGMAAWWMWLRVRYRSRPAAEQIVDTLREENGQLRADLEARMAELENRVDFTERRLVQERSPNRLPGSTARTPV